MVRLVFRPYTKICKAICTSAHVRASTRVSSGFALFRHSSPSFGSHHTRFLERTRLGTGCVSLSLRRQVLHPPTCASDGLLGPCFKTGRLRRMAREPCKDTKGRLPKVSLTAADGHTSETSSKAVPHARFRVLFTLFPKCFSAFPHGTSSLSDSRLYLTLDGAHHPLELRSQTVRLSVTPTGNLYAKRSGL